YAAYNLVDWKMITTNNGDVFDKAVVRLLECFESIKIINQSLDRIKGTKGEIWKEVREIPQGEGIGRHEAPRGEVFHYIRSDGRASSPIRHKIRAPSYVNIPTFKASCIGETISDVCIILAGVDPCYCCTERIAVYDKEKKKKVYSFEDLVKKSIEKTEKIKKEIGKESKLWKKLF
ncbi:MAG: NADH:ubiquinone oxidoreductase, partial [bacterium]|nr:NADH:ubiquinone oxidoreductase [bacterium]MDW8164710.1 NADH:ubiquinone oxidoreductase [Candidatus Omnitrophota bacterium]